jgi:hypothetical protein
LRRARLALVASLVAAPGACAFVACFPGYTFGGADADAGPDSSLAAPGDDSGAGTPVDSSIDGGAGDSGPGAGDAGDAGDAAPPVDAADASIPITVVPITSAGTKPTSTGYGYQQHLVYANHDARWWLFYVDDAPGVIQAMASADLAHWSTPVSVPLPATYSLDDGEAFSVAYADLAGHDVLHFLVNGDSGGGSAYASFHVRATIAGGGISASGGVMLPDTETDGGQGSSGGACTQDGPTTLVTGDGHVYDVTAWAGHPENGTTCDTNVYLATAKETGGAWSASFGHAGYYVSVPVYAFSHDLLPYDDAGLAMVLFPDEDNTNEFQFDSIGWAVSTTFGDAGGPDAQGVVEPSGSEVFAGAGGHASYNDWSACRLASDTVHLVRHVTSGTTPHVLDFQQATFTGGTWIAESAPLSVASPQNEGVVLLSAVDPSRGMLLAVLELDGSIQVQRWTKGTGWSLAASLAADPNRQSLAGSGCGSKRQVITWVAGAGPTFTIQAADLTALLGP